MILILNAGSSSLKFKLFAETEGKLEEIVAGKIARIGISDGPKNHQRALWLANKKIKRYKKKIKKIGHRVVHGADLYQAPVEINNQVIKNLKDIAHLAPLHEPAEIETIEEAKKIWHGPRHFAIFDTAFFKNLPLRTRLYGIPYQYYKKGIKRYGFHGISHKYVARRAAEKIKKDLKLINLITVHLGAGSSIAAISKAVAIDTSMGFTPTEGLLMATRSGDIDPGILIGLLKDGISADELDKLLNTKSGLLGLSGISSDMLDLLFVAGYPIEDKSYTPPSDLKCDQTAIERAKLSIDIFCYRIQKYIGAYSAILKSIDALVFTGAIGAGSSFIRDKIVSDIRKILGKARILSLTTDEELEIAKEIVNFRN